MLRPLKDFYKNVHAGFIHNSSKVETTQLSFSRTIDKQTVICSHNGILHSNKKQHPTVISIYIIDLQMNLTDIKLSA